MDEKKLTDMPGVGQATADKLSDAGFGTLMAVAVATPGELIEAAGVGESAAKKFIAFARTNCKMDFVTGKVMLDKREKVKRISTGSLSFNELVGGGFESGSITECFGEMGSGKTVLAHQLAINALEIDDKGEPKAYAVWIDTENTFRPERILEICNQKNINGEAVLDHIRVVRAVNSDHQMFCVEKVKDLIEKDKLKVNLIIVDSLMAHFRAEYVGRGTLADRQQKLNKHMHTLMRVADMHNLCVYVTNQVMSKPDSFFGNPIAAIGGNIVGHNSQTRLYLRRGQKGSRVAKLVDSPHLPDGEAIFIITSRGIEDL